MLTDGELAQMRVVAQATFDGTAIIQMRSFVSDGGGGGTSAWVPAGTVPCHLSPILMRGEREPVTGGRISPAADWLLTVPADTVISRDNRVTVASTTFEVAALRAPRTWEITRRVELNEVV